MLPEEQVITNDEQKTDTRSIVKNDENVVKEDILDRIKKFKPKPAQSNVDRDPEKFYPDDIEKIKDPEAKEYVMKAYKSLEKGYQEKFRTVADIRKELEQEKSKYSSWSPERVQELASDPNFVKAANALLGVNSNSDEWSNLTETEKKRLQDMTSKLNTLEQQNANLLKTKQDESLSQSYAEYDPQLVDKTIQQFYDGSFEATREHVWKMLDYDNGIKRAYQLGLEDRNIEAKEKVNSMSFDRGANVVKGDEPIVKSENENDKSFFARIVYNNLRKNGATK